ncbi:MAG: ribonuclease HII [Dehalococcoidia bacterium]|nr:ribonuclease HII [Dehalococcoidia bacterium]
MMMGSLPTFAEERAAHNLGYSLVAGLDEVGRGALAGPVFAAAVILPRRARFSWLKKVRDSKLLTPKQREELAPLIYRDAVAACVAQSSVEEIEERNILQATWLAMGRALEGLGRQPEFLLVDGMKLPRVTLPQKGIIAGDKLSFSIACASIVAKVARDHVMRELDGRYPGYGMARHKGYGTQEHMDSLRKLGASPIHRRSFAPVSMVLRVYD